jgi:hypothetical protein
LPLIYGRRTLEGAKGSERMAQCVTDFIWICVPASRTFCILLWICVVRTDRPTDTSHCCCFVIHSRYLYTLLIFCRNDTTFAELKVCNEPGNAQVFNLYINFFFCRVEYQVCPCDVCVVNRVALRRGFLRVLHFSLSVVPPVLHTNFFFMLEGPCIFELNCTMTKVMIKFLINLSIYFYLTCFGLSCSPSSEAGVQLRQWLRSAGYGVSALARNRAALSW